MAESIFNLGYSPDGAQFTPVKLDAADVVASNGITAETHILNNGIHLTSTQINLIANAIQNSMRGAPDGVAPLNDEGLLDPQYFALDMLTGVKFAEDIAQMIALTTDEVSVSKTVLVADASADLTVKSGWALYVRVDDEGDTLEDWHKLVEGESLDIDFADFLTKDDIGEVNGVAPLGGDKKVPVANLPGASTSALGIVELSDAINETSSDKAATPTAVKTAYDKAVTAQQAAENAASAASLRDVVLVDEIADIPTSGVRAGGLVLLKVETA